MHWSHYWWGIFCFNLPVGLLLCFVFHNIVRDSLLSNLPFFVYRKLAVYKGFNWNRHFANRWLTVLVSIVLASTLHIIWDALTHFSADVVLETRIFRGLEPSFRGSLIYYSIWSLNSLLGFVALAAWFQSLPDARVYLLKPVRSKYWILTVLTALSVITIRLIINSNLSLISLVDTCISATFIGLLMSSLTGEEQVCRKKSAQHIIR